MPGMQLLVLGIGDAFSARYYSSSFAVGIDDNWLLLDCPHPIRKMLAEASHQAQINLDLFQIQGVLLSHLHADHCSGLEGYLYFCRYAMDGQRGKIIAHPDVSQHLWRGHLSAGMEWSYKKGDAPQQRTLADFAELIALEENSMVDVGPFQIECRKTLHSLPTTAFRIHGGGKTIGFSADTAFDPTLIDWLAKSDLIIHEAGEGAVHTPYEKLAELPHAITQKMRLTHISDRFDPKKSAIPVLQPGELLQI